MPKTSAAAPVGMRVSAKLLDQYRELQDHYVHPRLDQLGIDRRAEDLELKIFRATGLDPGTPFELVDWVLCWLHVLAFGAEARSHKPVYAYGKPPRGCYHADWCLHYPDATMLIDELSDADRGRCDGFGTPW